MYSLFNLFPVPVELLSYQLGGRDASRGRRLRDRRPLLRPLFGEEAEPLPGEIPEPEVSSQRQHVRVGDQVSRRSAEDRRGAGGGGGEGDAEGGAHHPADPRPQGSGRPRRAARPPGQRRPAWHAGNSR